MVEHFIRLREKELYKIQLNVRLKKLAQDTTLVKFALEDGFQSDGKLI